MDVQCLGRFDDGCWAGEAHSICGRDLVVGQTAGIGGDHNQLVVAGAGAGGSGLASAHFWLPGPAAAGFPYCLVFIREAEAACSPMLTRNVINLKKIIVTDT